MTTTYTIEVFPSNYRSKTQGLTWVIVEHTETEHKEIARGFVKCDDPNAEYKRSNSSAIDAARVEMDKRGIINTYVNYNSCERGHDAMARFEVYRHEISG